MSETKGTLVTFNVDIFPHVKGEAVRLTEAELARVDEVAKARGVDKPYTAGNRTDQGVKTPYEAEQVRAGVEQNNVRVNEIDQSAVLEAQRNAVAEPANTYAVGVVNPEPAQVVTGTKSVADVKVKNPNEATDIGSGEGVDVAGKAGKELKEASSDKS